MDREPFEYQQILYNEAIAYLEQKWNRKLDEHERHVLIEAYKFGRMVQSEEEDLR